MIRTQVQLTTGQIDALRNLSRSSGKSVAELIRNAVDQLLTAKPASDRTDQVARALKVVGRFASGKSDVSRNHDQYLAEAFSLQFR